MMNADELKNQIDYMQKQMDNLTDRMFEMRS